MPRASPDRRRLPAIAAVALLALGPPAPPSSAQEAQPFYAGKTIKLIVGLPPGGGADAYARLVQRHLGRHIPGAPAILIQNMPGAGSLRSVMALNASPDDGTVMAHFSSALLSEAITAPERPGHWLDPGPLGCLGVGAPFALAAKKLYPNKKVLVISGDGSFGLNGFDFETCVRFKLPVTVVVGNDAAWGQIRGPQIMIFGAERAPATALAPTRYDKVVEAFGGRGAHVVDPAQLTATIKAALHSSSRPMGADARSDAKASQHSRLPAAHSMGARVPIFICPHSPAAPFCP